MRWRSRPVRPGWPARLQHGNVVVRPMVRGDAAAWREVRQRNAEWLMPWEATVPDGATDRPRTFSALMVALDAAAAAGTVMPFVVEVGGEFAGQLTVSNITGGAAQMATIGYWLDQRHAGKGVMPTAVALVIDHCFDACGLHRIEISIRPENTNSLRIAEKLDLYEVGYAPRYLHINGDWRDHRVYALTVEQRVGRMIDRL